MKTARKIIGALVAGLLSGSLAGCLGGDGTSKVPDAAPQPDLPDSGAALSACAMAMQAAPEGGSYMDSLPTATVNTWDGATIPEANDPNYPGGKYRTLTPDGAGNIHPGCTVEGLAPNYPLAEIPDYPCAAKQYPFPDGVTEDTTKPIVILVHGNSDSPVGFEAYLHPNPGGLGFPADTEARDQLAERLPKAGYRTIAVDLRIDKVDDPNGDLATGNPPDNVDHGWAVPITQELIKRVIIANPDRKVSVIGFSLGTTVARDALRRLFVEHTKGDWDKNVFAHVQDVIAAAGANHGVVSGGLCTSNRTMRGTVTCDMGLRNTYTQTPFHTPLNGPAIDTVEEFGGWFETPCADGSYAFGLRDACDGHAVQYTTVTMQDLPDGTQQDEFVSEHAARLYPLDCANNVLVGLNDIDTSGYLLNGLFRNHYGAVRSDAGMDAIMAALAN